jgi:hypothetical protein
MCNPRESGFPRLARMQVEHPNSSITVILRAALAFAGVALSMMAATTQAQTVRKCTIEGKVVFQASTCPVDKPATVIAPSKTAAVDVPAAPKKKTLADVIRERDGAENSRGPIREFKSDGADVLRSRMGAV